MFTTLLAEIIPSLGDVNVAVDALAERHCKGAAKREALGWFILERLGLTNPIFGKLITKIRDRDSTRHGTVYEGRTSDAMAEVVPGESIRLFGITTHTEYTKNPDGSYDHVKSDELFERTFKVGDSATYGSYNLIYIGTIISITEKTVTIEESRMNSYETHGKRHRLNIYDFDSKNRHFDVHEAAARNHETMMYI